MVGDPVRLLSEMRTAQRALVVVADQGVEGSAATGVPLTEKSPGGVAHDLEAGRDAVHGAAEAEGRRRRPDPLLVVTAELWAWFDADPSRRRRELLKRLQAEPGQLRSAAADAPAPRLKVWPGEMAQALVFT